MKIMKCKKEKKAFMGCRSNVRYHSLKKMIPAFNNRNRKCLFNVKLYEVSDFTSVIEIAGFHSGPEDYEDKKTNAYHS